MYFLPYLLLFFCYQKYSGLICGDGDRLPFVLDKEYVESATYVALVATGGVLDVHVYVSFD